MNKKLWIVKQIDSWEQENLIESKTAQILRKKYIQNRHSSSIIIASAIIGATLIGAGIILIFAKNWYKLPLVIKTILSFTPLVVIQLLALFVVLKKNNSIAWREAVAIIYTGCVFASIAMISQTFHIAGDIDRYLLVCALLIIPLIYILNAISPLIVYFYGIISWVVYSIEEPSIFIAVIFCILYVVGIYYVFSIRKSLSARYIYGICLSVIVGFIVVWIIAKLFLGSVLLLLLAYFALLFSYESNEESIVIPVKIIGTIGSITILYILTYLSMWKYSWYLEKTYVSFIIFFFAILILSIFFAFKNRKKSMISFFQTFMICSVCICRFIWMYLINKDNAYTINSYASVLSLLCNVSIVCIGIGFIILGYKKISLKFTNIGLAIIFILIILRFFDTEMDFLWRGIVFLVLGSGFLILNIKLSKKKSELKHIQNNGDLI